MPPCVPPHASFRPTAWLSVNYLAQYQQSAQGRKRVSGLKLCWGTLRKPDGRFRRNNPLGRAAASVRRNSCKRTKKYNSPWKRTTYILLLHLSQCKTGLGPVQTRGNKVEPITRKYKNQKGKRRECILSLSGRAMPWPTSTPSSPS